jgi:hypothetical protein
MPGNAKKLAARLIQPGHDTSFKKTEKALFIALTMILPESDWTVEEHPRDLTKIIDGKYGIVPDVVIRHKASGRVMYFEAKKQGDSGNADERACRHHTVAFYKLIKDTLKLKYHPFVTVFCDALSTNPRYTVKHPAFFEEGNYLAWEKYDLVVLYDFLIKHVVPVLAKGKK